MQDVIGKLESYPEIIELIERAITDNPPIQITEGNIIRDGYHEQLDRYRDAMNNGKLWIAMLQKEEEKDRHQNAENWLQPHFWLLHRSNEGEPCGVARRYV